MENQALHRVFNVFLLGLAAECYLFIVQRFYTASTVSSLLLWDRILRWGVWLGLVMLVAGVVVAVVKRNQAKLRRHDLGGRDRGLPGGLRLGHHPVL